jgi:predicted site-specific integrase-resolvase
MAGSHMGLLSWKCAARHLSLSESSLRRLVRQGKLAPPIEVTTGRKAVVYEDIEEFRQQVIARSRGS